MKMHGLLLLLPLLYACAQQPLRQAQDESALDRWVTAELSPYLAQQLARHPRFRGEPVILVRLIDQDIQPDIDGLSESIRARVRDALLGSPGVNLPWQPQQHGPRHHRRLADVDCGNTRVASYYIGIEISATPAGQHRVSLRALDVRARQWVGGFSKSWQGALSASELAAMGRLRIDESLRGLRVLPFGADQSDLAADYLANNLSCLLRQQDEQELVIHIAPGESKKTRFPGLLKMVGNNLARYREVRVTEQKSEAGFTLRGETHEIGEGLSQIWLVLQPRRSGLHLPGMDTATYIAADPARGGVPPHSPSLPAAVTNMRVSPDSADACANPAATGGCQRLQVETANARQLFVIRHAKDSGLVRLLPSGCAGVPEQVGGRQRYLVAGLDGGAATYYGIAVQDRQLQGTFSRHMQQLPDGCSVTVGERLSDSRLQSWLERLDRMIADNPERVAWAARRSGG